MQVIEKQAIVRLENCSLFKYLHYTVQFVRKDALRRDHLDVKWFHIVCYFQICMNLEETWFVLFCGLSRG